MQNTPPITDADCATYIAEACADMRTLSASPRLRTINYLLDQVRAEAERIVKGPEPRATRPAGMMRRLGDS